jgi:hypothetical protein
MLWEAAQFPAALLRLGRPAGADGEDRRPWRRQRHLRARTRARYFEYAPLFHLLPKRVLDLFGLPLLRGGQWPFMAGWAGIDNFLPPDLEAQLARAWAWTVWPHLMSGSKMKPFSAEDPIRLLAHAAHDGPNRRRHAVRHHYGMTGNDLGPQENQSEGSNKGTGNDLGPQESQSEGSDHGNSRIPEREKRENIVTVLLGLAWALLANFVTVDGVELAIIFAGVALLAAARWLKRSAQKRSYLERYSRIVIVVLSCGAMAIAAILSNRYTTLIVFAVTIAAVLLMGDLDRILYVLAGVALIGSGFALAWGGIRRFVVTSSPNELSIAIGGLALLCGSLAVLGPKNDKIFERARRTGGLLLAASGAIAAVAGRPMLGIGVAITGLGFLANPLAAGVAAFAGLIMAGAANFGSGKIVTGLSAVLGALTLALAGVLVSRSNKVTRRFPRLTGPDGYVVGLTMGALALVVGGVSAILSRETLAGVTVVILGIMLFALALSIWFREHREQVVEHWHNVRQAREV